MKPLVLAALFALALAVPAWAGYAEGLAANKREDYAAALKEFQLSAEQGEARAQVQLGFLYYLGQGTPKDDVEAVKWFGKAARQGNDLGQDGLKAVLADLRNTVDRGDYSIVPVLQALADQDYAKAQILLGYMYEYGKGVLQDHVNAVKWYRNPAVHGDSGAQILLADAYLKGQGVPQDYSEAMKWFRKAAEQGNASGQFNLGAFYADGKGVPQDYSEAMKWFRKAAEQGEIPAQFNLALLYDKGWGAPQEYAEAVKWYRKAAEQGDFAAQTNLGFMYANGQGVPQDYVQAHMWFNLAGTDGDDKATKNRDTIAKKMTPADVSKAQRLARGWLEKHSK